MKIVFVCTGNTCRSPMAEGFMKSILLQNGISGVEVISRGLSAETGSGASQNSVIAAKELGADISSHIAAQLTVDDIQSADYVFTMTSAHKDAIVLSLCKYHDKIHTISQFTSSDEIKDPYGADIEVYRQCAKSIKSATEKIYKALFGADK